MNHIKRGKGKDKGIPNHFFTLLTRSDSSSSSSSSSRGDESSGSIRQTDVDVSYVNFVYTANQKTKAHVIGPP